MLTNFKAIVRLSLAAIALSAAPALACPVNKAVDIEWNGSIFPGTVLEGPDAQGHCFVSYDDWDESWNEWVAPSRLTLLDVASACVIGQTRQIEWNGSLWAGTILDGPNAAGECFVTYEGWDESWNEWVGQDRLPVNEVAAPVPVGCRVGAELEIMWNGDWWAGTVLEGPDANGQCFVTYEGWDASWNEWVAVDRMRVAENN